ncbi:MAG: hypothetical protein ABGZ35_04840, partial [Planctomycetaceae bacterium]
KPVVHNEPAVAPGTHGETINWQDRISAVKAELPQDRSPDLTRIREQLDSVEQFLVDHHGTMTPESNGAVAISNELESIRQQSEALRSPSKPPTFNAGDLNLQIQAEAEILLKQERDETQKVIEAAIQAVRNDREPELRPARLALRDRQDEVAMLQEHIARGTYERNMFEQKNSRDEALRSSMADVRKYLSPFTSPGYLQPNSLSNPRRTERTDDAMPVSLSRLERLGALDPTPEGLERLYEFGGGKNGTRSPGRPLGAFPKYTSFHLQRPAVLAAVRRAQELLREHGQALIEAKILSP